MKDDFPLVTPSSWERLRAYTRARIALGRAGHSLPTAEVLAFGAAHALAQDAVHTPVDFGPVEAVLNEGGQPWLYAHSEAPDRATYLRRPDLGRRVREADLERLRALHGPRDVVLVVGDGLSADAVRNTAPAYLRVLLAELSAFRLAPVVLLHQARVAAADLIGEALGARLSLMLLGERPGLQSADSLGLYLTYAPRPGRRDAERTCISNIHAQGLLPAVAARATRMLVQVSLGQALSGVKLLTEAPFPSGAAARRWSRAASRRASDPRL